MSRRDKRVDHRDPHPVETARDLVARPAELAPAVQPRERDLDAGQLVLGVDVGRDAAAVVDHPAAAVGQQGHVDTVAEAGHRLVDRVVDDLPDEVVQPGRPGRPDEHARALADRLQALQHGHVLGGVHPVDRGHPTAPVRPWSSSAFTSCSGRTGARRHGRRARRVQGLAGL